MNESTSPFFRLLIVVFLAFLVPLVLSRFKRLRLPIVVGEILAGILVGQSGFQIVPSNEPILVFLAQLGLAFLMFLSGMEIDFSNLSFEGIKGARSSKVKLGPVPLAGLSFLITLTISMLLGFLFQRFGLVKNPWMMGLILSTTSLGVVVPVLKETGLINSRYGQMLLISALIADFVTMFLITVVIAAISHGLTFNILLIFILFVAFFLMTRFGMVFSKAGAVRRTLEELSHATAQIKVRAAFTVMLIFVVLSEVLGTEIILGAFLAGVIIALIRTPEDDQATLQLESFGYGFLIPIFFIKVGIDFQLSALFSSSSALLLVPILVVAAASVKLLSAAVFRLSFSMRETLAAGALLSARLSLIIAASAVGAKMGIISQPVNSAIILVALITVTASPLVFMRLLPHHARKPVPCMIVYGAEELGLQVARILQSHHEQVVVIDTDGTRVQRACQHGYEAFESDLENPDPKLLKFLSQSPTLICTYSDSELNYEICAAARMKYGVKRLVAQVSNPGDMYRFEQLGVHAMNGAVDRAGLMALLARNPATYALLTQADDDKEICEVEVRNRRMIGKALKQLALPGDTLILALRRQGELLVPHGNTTLNHGDNLTLVGSTEWVGVAREMFIEY